jgi:hypothetical protein
MKKAIVFTPPDEVIDDSLDARQCLDRLNRRLELERRSYQEVDGELSIEEGVESVAVLTGLSALELSSGYMEMELDTIFRPQELLERLRRAVPEDFPLVAVVDDAYSDYITSVCLRAGASAVVGTSGALFGIVTSRIGSWSEIAPYINAFESV